MNRLRELERFGVSVWLDSISRALIESGELARLIEADGLRGVTSNPTIFEKTIGASHDYDGDIRRLAREGLSPQDIFERLASSDIRAAADLFAPVYKESGGRDGFVSLEVAPSLARDAEATHREALRLHAMVGRPNVMIKIPATAEGLRAIEETIADGVPVNVTLLFSQERYVQAAEAYLKGLERRAARKKDLSRVSSVASFFVSRVDTAVDAELESRLKTAPAGEKTELASLLGRAAVANGKLAYQIYKREFGSARFAALQLLGARPQRLLWASTGAKNLNYRDVLYVEELIGSDVVNTMPPATVNAFRDHGVCRPSLDGDVAEALRDWEGLKSRGIDLAAVARKLESDGVDAFARSFETLLGQLAAKKELLAAGEGTVGMGLAELSEARFSSRLWDKDPSLWKAEAQHQKIIRNSLGWLTVSEAMAAGLGQIRGFASEVQKENFRHAVVLGMGGSSLVCEVFRTCFPVAKGCPALEVLDSTNPESVAALESRIDLKRTLFIVSSKSGSTIEPNCFFEHFHEKVLKLAQAPGRQFTAITDRGTSLEKLANAGGFRKVFANPSDIGGRYSALSFFGLVPAALMGVDLERLLTRTREAARGFSSAKSAEDNEALRLGAAMGRHARAGRDKLTLSLPPALESFGLWVEQLVAESTGKEGRGILPVVGEPLGAPDSYGNDRLFVRLSLADAPEPDAERKLAALERAGHPVMTLRLKDLYDLGGQFLLWEIATAAAGFLIGVDPFDQPDVQRAKDRTKELLSSLDKGELPEETPSFRAGGLAAFADAELSRRLAKGRPERVPQASLPEALRAHLGRLGPGDYCAVLAYLPADEANRILLETIQQQLRRLAKAPVTLGWGPRYLHSTGQLHKGGSGSGLFLMLTEPERTRLPVPGEPFSFGTLHRAQSRGDFAAIVEAGRRVLRLELAPAGSNPLKALSNALEELLGEPKAGIGL